MLIIPVLGAEVGMSGALWSAYSGGNGLTLSSVRENLPQEKEGEGMMEERHLDAIL